MSTVQRNAPGKGRKNRIGISLETTYENMLKRLAISCDMQPTTMAYVLIKKCLDDSAVIHQVQAEFATSDDYRVIRTVDQQGKPKLELYYGK